MFKGFFGAAGALGIAAGTAFGMDTGGAL